MAKLVWDATGTRNIQAGISKVVLYPMNSDGSYYSGIAWSGVTAINEAPGGADITDLYADNIKYASLRAAETFGFSIEAYDYPDEWSECDGSAQAQAGVLLGQQPRKAFGLVYRTEIGDDTHPGMDKGHIIHIVYNSTASPSSRGYSTINNNPDAISMSWDAQSTPVNVDKTNYKPVCTITINSTKCDSAKLAALEDILYGSEKADAELPDPATVLSTLS